MDNIIRICNPMVKYLKFTSNKKKYEKFWRKTFFFKIHTYGDYNIN